MGVLLLILAALSFLVAAVSAFSEQVNVNEIGWLAVGLVLFAASFLPWTSWTNRAPRA